MDYISFLPRRFSPFFILFLSLNTSGQVPIKSFNKDSIEQYISSELNFNNKVIPTEFEDQIKIALQYFPELTETKIKFRVKKRASPLSASPTFWALFRKASKRKYKITISSKSISKLEPVLLKNLSLNAQIGVLGHEISHVATYNSKQGVYFIKLVFMHLSKKKIDKAEYETDKVCVQHGLGYQLLAWSSEIREKLELKQWSGSNSITGERERYMNPETIRNYIKEMKIYN